ncbi:MULTISPECIES: flagellar export chaperone FliS [Helicobacter]|uniref:Flagellar export chaperone FliS n=1 Tax=Helicobacter ibis TaxID=2962633 RepID=A0ABT4VDE4_9HELI|nr:MULTISPECIES: flagellar export chaperone FliS [Helicobacter]MDA3967812.1 flagellar export chaperone FliS [Helicobacter sp. WB40]MDA3968714.1 flagellar export chaperone FliS [Helicobacter ibis]
MNGAAYNSYQQNSVAVESPARLVEMLYEGILRFSSMAKRCIDSGDIEKKIYYINRTTDIFVELLNSLDYEKGGQVAHYLTGLYTHQIKLLTQANMENNKEKIDIVIKVTKGLLEAWKEVNHELAQ